MGSRGRQISESEAILVYRESSRTAWATYTYWPQNADRNKLITKAKMGIADPSPGLNVWAKPVPLPSLLLPAWQAANGLLRWQCWFVLRVTCEVGGGIGLCVLRSQGIIHILEVLQV